MARKPRLEFPGAFYHVITRGNNRQKIFGDGRDYKNFLERLRFYKKRFQFIMYAYVLMPNHVHMLIETREIPLSRIMQVLQFTYTQRFNRRHKKIGHLFQGRYKAILCQKETYLLELIRYIILNPLRAGLTGRLLEWPWSSYFDIMRQNDGHIVSVKDVLGLFGKQRRAAIKGFQRFINDGLSNEHKEEYYKLKDQRILGDDCFAEEIIKSEIDDFWHYNISMDDVVSLTAKHLFIGVCEIMSSTRNRCGAKARGVVAHICKAMGGFTAKEVSRYFKRSEAMISKLVKWVDVERTNNVDFKNTLQKIEGEIKKRYSPCLARRTKVN